MRKSRLFVAAGLAAALTAAVAGHALGWGASGHRVIGQLAVETLPAEVPAFLRGKKAVAAMEARRYAEARTLAAAVLSQEAHRSEAWALHGMAAEALGDYEAAETSLAHAVDRYGCTSFVVPLAG